MISACFFVNLRNVFRIYVRQSEILCKHTEVVDMDISLSVVLMMFHYEIEGMFGDYFVPEDGASDGVKLK